MNDELRTKQVSSPISQTAKAALEGPVIHTKKLLNIQGYKHTGYLTSFIEVKDKPIMELITKCVACVIASNKRLYLRRYVSGINILEAFQCDLCKGCIKDMVKATHTKFLLLHTHGSGYIEQIPAINDYLVNNGVPDNNVKTERLKYSISHIGIFMHLDGKVTIHLKNEIYFGQKGVIRTVEYEPYLGNLLNPKIMEYADLVNLVYKQTSSPIHSKKQPDILEERMPNPENFESYFYDSEDQEFKKAKYHYIFRCNDKNIIHNIPAGSILIAQLKQGELVSMFKLEYCSACVFEAILNNKRVIAALHINPNDIYHGIASAVKKITALDGIKIKRIFFMFNEAYSAVNEDALSNFLSPLVKSHKDIYQYPRLNGDKGHVLIYNDDGVLKVGIYSNSKPRRRER